MIFSLEVVRADEGDCLILYYGKDDSINIVLIDGGPSGVYKKYLKPRLEQVKESLSADSPLPVSLVMVSHLDDDHVNGILALVKELTHDKAAQKESFVAIQDMWFNTFDDIVGNTQLPQVAAINTASADAVISSLLSNFNVDIDEPEAAVVASTGQGRTLRDLTTTLAISVNEPFEKVGKSKVKMAMSGTDSSQLNLDGLKVTVLHPNIQRLNELQTQWDKDLAKAKAGKPKDLLASLGDKDKSPFNLSSIVCMVEYKNKRILLTGDAKSGDIEIGLKENGFLDEDGKLHVDVLKMPHHGSERNISPEFLEKITADQYVISADGKHSNPDQATLDKIAEVNANKAGITLHMTNKEGEEGLTEKVKDYLAGLKADNNKMKVNFRKHTATSIVLNLLDEVDF
jgi:hypothetical protein